MTNDLDTVPLVCDLILRNGFIVTVDDERRVLERGSIAIAGDRVVAVGEDRELARMTAAREVDCAGKVVMPGFVDTHDHLFQNLVRTLGESEPTLYSWVANFIVPLVSGLDAESMRAAGILGAMCAASSGITCILDNPYWVFDPAQITALAEGISAVGVRGIIGRGMYGPGTPFAREIAPSAQFKISVREDIALTEHCMQEHPWGNLVAVVPYPEQVCLVPDELIHESVALARKYGTPWQMHGTEDPGDSRLFLQHHGVTPVEWLFSEGLLDRSASLAHCLSISPAEIELLAATAASVSHNPISNLASGQGVCPTRPMIDAGVNVALGIDGSASVSFDMFTAMNAARLAQRAATSNMDALSYEESLEMATLGGARLLGIDAGQLKVGALADIAIVDMSDIRMSPTHIVVSQLALAGSSRDVFMTIVNGTITFEDGKFPLIDQEAETAEIHRNLRRLGHALPAVEPRTTWRRRTRNSPQ